MNCLLILAMDSWKKELASGKRSNSSFVSFGFLAVIIVSMVALHGSAIAGFANAETQTWAKTMGGFADEDAHSVQGTSDGGYIVVGETTSFGSSSAQMWIIKMAADGVIEWQKRYDGCSHANTIRQTSDGGYIVGACGLIKLAADGGIMWQKNNPSHEINYAEETADGGYVAVGINVIMINGLQHEGVVALKTDADGVIEWQMRYEDARFNDVRSVKQTSDGGYIIGGSNIHYDTPTGTADIWLIKLDSEGAIEWEKEYGEDNANEFLSSLELTSDGGYIVGSTGSLLQPSLVLKIDSEGNIEWEKALSIGLDMSSLRQTTDGGFAAAGTSFTSAGAADFFLLKLNPDGVLEWAKTYGGSSGEIESSMDHTADGGYILAGLTRSFGVRNSDVWVLKVDSNGNVGNCSVNLAHDIAPSATDTISTVANTSAESVDLLTTMQDRNPVVKNTSAAIGIQCEPGVPQPSATCDEPTIIGTEGNDIIDGTPEADVISAKGGDDTINGLGGNDVICGGSGNDTISGGSGADVIFGGYGNDSISGGTGNDEVNGGAGNDSLAGNGGNDKIFGSSGNDTLNGKDGVVNNDSLDGGIGTDTCNSNPDSEVNCEV